MELSARIVALKKQISDDLASPEFNNWSTSRCIGTLYSELAFLVSIVEDLNDALEKERQGTGPTEDNSRTSNDL